uniref:Sodium/hydrogen exchanger n=1 Tax=Saccoglossus kowalevskii TaxID=10224 RepID=A0ABM0MN52_SACKO|nr:PREDICTED: sodium/hydrogen exchanger 7-like [Saccoglossus kowalevskii]
MASHTIILAVLWLVIAPMGWARKLAVKDPEAELEREALQKHRLDSINLLIFIFLLVCTVLTVWLFKHRRFRFLHETGLAMIYGMIVGAIIKYSGRRVNKYAYSIEEEMNQTFAPEILWLKYTTTNDSTPARIFSYELQGIIHDPSSEIQIELEEKATFDPEVFFNILLPPIIFHAGYCIKRKHFFRNLGAILMFAFIGTTISCIVVGFIVYGFVQLMPWSTFSLKDCLYFGALISATDPVSVLAIFFDLHVDVDMYALVFGESVMNDAVAIVLAATIDNYRASEFDVEALFTAVGSFLGIFFGSFLIGGLMGCINALLTKFTKIRDFPILETVLFCLLSYSTFLIAESFGLTGIVAMLFCGMTQAHYTYNNLSDESKKRTKELFELLNFLSENFIFSYMGVAMFTFQSHQWHIDFIAAAFLAVGVARVCNIYPLSFLLNLGRKNKISFNFQHMLVFAGLRGAIAFALAIRNTETAGRQTMLTTTLMIVIVTIVVCGGGTTQMLTWLKIRVGVEDDDTTGQNVFQELGTDERLLDVDQDPNAARAIRRAKKKEQAWLVSRWYNFDHNYVKPVLTNRGADLSQTLPGCCSAVARCLTRKEESTMPRRGSDSEIILDDELSYGEMPTIIGGGSTDDITPNITPNPHDQDPASDGDLGLGDHEMSPRSQFKGVTPGSSQV